MKGKTVALCILLLLCITLPLAAEGAFGLSVNGGSILLPSEAALDMQTLYASADYAIYLGSFILQPCVDAGVGAGVGFIADAGLGLGYRFVDASRYSLEATLTPYAGECGYQVTRFVWGARAMLRGRLRLIGRLGLMAQVGAEWRNGAGVFELPVLGLGLTL